MSRPVQMLEGQQEVTGSSQGMKNPSGQVLKQKLCGSQNGGGQQGALCRL